MNKTERLLNNYRRSVVEMYIISDGYVAAGWDCKAVRARYKKYRDQVLKTMKIREKSCVGARQNTTRTARG
jgi:hypothetical protein